VAVIDRWLLSVHDSRKSWRPFNREFTQIVTRFKCKASTTSGAAISGMFRSRNSVRSRMSDRWFQSGSEIVPSYLSVEVAPAFVVCRLEMKVSVGTNKNTPLAEGHASWLNLRKQEPSRWS